MGKLLYAGILTIPMVTLFHSMASTGWSEYKCKSDLGYSVAASLFCESATFVAVVGTGVGSVLTAAALAVKLEH